MSSLVLFYMKTILHLKLLKKSNESETEYNLKTQVKTPIRGELCICIDIMTSISIHINIAHHSLIKYIDNNVILGFKSAGPSTTKGVALSGAPNGELKRSGNDRVI